MGDDGDVPAPDTTRRARAKRAGLVFWLAASGSIVGLVLVQAMTGHPPPRGKTTRLILGYVKSAVNTYYATVGQYPTQSEGFRALLNPPDGLKPMLQNEPKDDWGNPLRYLNPPLSGRAPFEIQSAGADGEFGTDDDLTSIRREDRYPKAE